MNSLTRRTFLVASGVVGGAALAQGATSYAFGDILQTATWNAKPAGARTLVVVTLYGGNDGLSTVVPYADSAYHDARPGLAYGADEVLRLDDRVGLNPGLANLKRLYDAGQLAIVRGVGYPRPDHSHFRAMDIWQTGQPDRPGSTGWLGRWLDATGGDPRYAVSFEPVLPPLLAGATVAGAAVPLTGLRQTGVPSSVLSGFGAPSRGEPPLQGLAARAFADLLAVNMMIEDVADRPDAPLPADDNHPQGTGTGGGVALARQLDLVARCVEANVATRVFSVSLGGFDTHADEKGTQQRLLGEVDSALGGFADRMVRSEAGRNVVVAVYSEFGRRVRANASDGTDHGTAGDVFLLGAPVRGGLYGTPPSLTDLDQGDLRYGTDFRDIYATLLHRVLGADPARILGGWAGRLDQALT